MFTLILGAACATGIAGDPEWTRLYKEDSVGGLVYAIWFMILYMDLVNFVVLFWLYLLWLIMFLICILWLYQLKLFGLVSEKSQELLGLLLVMVPL